MFSNIYPREKYLKKLRPFYSSDIIKIITGIRRCGKSSILKAIINELLSSGVGEDDIVYIPLDQRGFKNISAPLELEKVIDPLIEGKGFCYIFIDEVENVKGFEKTVQAYAEEGHSVFLTGSNSYLLSDEISTKLTGRYLKFETFTLDFCEYLEMKRFLKKDINGDLLSEFEEYIYNGGFPKALEFDGEEAKCAYERGIVEEIFEKDVRKRKKVTNVPLFERVESFLISNYASPFSLQSLLKALEKEGYKCKPSTIRNYIEILKKAKIVYECNRFDLKSKRALCREQKYYLSDLSIYFSLNTDSRISFGPSLENLVYLYLLSNGYEVSIGKIGDFECDFIVRNEKREYRYIQVAYSLHGGNKEASEKITEREYRPFYKIKDGYPRYIITLDRLRDSKDGINHINAIDLFLGKAKI